MTIQQSAILSIIKLILDDAFQRRHKLLPTAFMRMKKLPFRAVVGMVLRLIKQSLQISCNWLGELIDSEPASKQAFSQARHKISAECFQELHADGLRVNYTQAPEKGLWKGYRLISCDGSTARLPELEELAKEFGRCSTEGTAKESPPMARISEFADMALKLVINGKIVPYKVSEEVLAKEQLIEVVDLMKSLGQKKLLFVYDRGYPSEEFINLHLKLDTDFIFRLPKNFNKAIKQIYQQGQAENFLIREDLPMLRVAQFTLPFGEVELLLTTLTDEQLFPLEVLSEVYFGRWGAMEEGYKRQKITMQLENFSGKTPLAIKQEYWATLTVANIIEMGCIEIEGCWLPGRLPERRVNRSIVFGSMRDATIEVIFGIITPDEYNEKFKATAYRAMLKARPGRSYSRAGVGKPKCHHVYRRSC